METIESLLYPVFNFLHKWYWVLGIVFVVCATISVWIGAFSLNRPGVKQWLPYIVAFWILAPPVYFFTEFHVSRAYYESEEAKISDAVLKQTTITKDRSLLSDVKESQDLASKVWAGVVAVISLLYLKSDGSRIPGGPSD
jgi:hypothetical protein